MNCGERIRVARLAKGYTQKRLGQLCEIAEPTIRRYELGSLNPKIETIKKIATALKLPPSFFLGEQPFSNLKLILESKEKILDSLKEWCMCISDQSAYSMSDYDYFVLIAENVTSLEDASDGFIFMQGKGISPPLFEGEKEPANGIRPLEKEFISTMDKILASATSRGQSPSDIYAVSEINADILIKLNQLPQEDFKLITQILDRMIANGKKSGRHDVAYIVNESKE